MGELKSSDYVTSGKPLRREAHGSSRDLSTMPGSGALVDRLAALDIPVEAIRCGPYHSGFETVTDAVQLAMDNIAFSNSSDTPSTDQRTVSFTLVDGGGIALGGSDTGSAEVVIDDVRPKGLPPTGHPVRFLNASPYFLSGASSPGFGSTTVVSPNAIRPLR